jgi:hypothetical protein
MKPHQTIITEYIPTQTRPYEYYRDRLLRVEEKST